MSSFRPDAAAEASVPSSAPISEGQFSTGESTSKLQLDLEQLRADVRILQRDLLRIVDDSAVAPNDSGGAIEHESDADQAGVAATVRRHPLRALIAMALLAVALIGGARAWRYSQTYESTDDAEINAHIGPVSSRIYGTVAKVYVEENQYVKKGALLAEIDAHGYADAVARAGAGEDEAAATVGELESAVEAARAQLAAAAATGTQARRDAHRWSDLQKGRIVSAHEGEQYTTAARIAAANTAAMRAEMVSYQKALLAAEAARRAAHAAAVQAQLNLGYTRIYAPMSGIVGKRSVEVGQRVQPGEDLMAIVHRENLWVTANFKETQLRRIHPGERATIHVDSLDEDFDARVESIAGASGAKYSVLPPENATGNYVRVIQRIPVRIRLLPDQQETSSLRPGMSVEATVWLQ